MRHPWLWLAVIFMPACVGTIEDPPAADAPTRTPESRRALPPQPIHRLNRLEYDNTVRDLLGTSSRPADAFPPDGESNGFDNMAEALQLTPTLLDGYYTAARQVIDEALDDRPAYLFDFRAGDLDISGGYPVGDLWGLSGHAFEVTVTVPAGGATVTLRAGASRIGPAPAPELRFELDGAVVDDFVVRGSAAAPERHVHSVHLEAGAHRLRYTPTNFVNRAAENTSNNVLFRSLEVRSDQVLRGPGRELVYVCDPREAAEGCYHVIIQNFGRRAWRRPLLVEEGEALVSLWDELRAEGESDEQALRLVMRAIMTSPKFLYRARTTTDADTEEWVDDHVLASRLSYFLWSSMPDERLFAAAAAGRLSSEDGLAEAVDWMLADDKARGLLDGFAEQWLSTRGLATASPSPEVYPSFDEALRSAMEAESKLLFADFFGNGLPLTGLLRPDFAYLNDRLAEHHELPLVGSDDLVRVPADAVERAGVLSLGAWLTVQSDAEHSSPIKRGRWVSEHILCQPVPAPPPGLEIEPVVLGEDVSVREQLERHRDDPQCASCHALLDVLGMGLEEFDGVGRRRTDADLDTMGELPDGRTFDGADELARAVDAERFVECVTRKLFTYSVGRTVRAVDQPHLEEIARQAVARGDTLPDVIRAIVLTPGFRAPAPIDGRTLP